MCGICGVVVLDGPPPDRELVTRMIGRLRHRGPDGSGLYRDDHAALGHTRLAIIDTEGGAQPLCNEDETVWISFNGEIFNYVELGEELRRCGHRFRTASDTEVVVHAWEEWGERVLHPLQRPVGPGAVGLARAAARALARPPRRAPALLHA